MSYYVYNYVDPRDGQPFYIGKGIGDRKNAHLVECSDSEKVKRIADIQAAGLEPIVRIVARDLTEKEAFLVEKSMIWSITEYDYSDSDLTNISAGHYSDNFRPNDTIKEELVGFDYINDVYYFNVSKELEHRSYKDFIKYGFISAGAKGTTKFKKAMESFNIGDIVCAYLPGSGYLGVARITSHAVSAHDYTINGVKLDDMMDDLECKLMTEYTDGGEEFICSVEWLASVPAEEAVTWKGFKHFSNQNAKASMANQEETKRRIAESFGLDFKVLTQR